MPQTVAGYTIPALGDPPNGPSAFQTFATQVRADMTAETAARTAADLAAVSAEQTIVFTPPGAEDTPGSGSANWIPIGNVTVPAGMTQCLVDYALNGVYENSGTTPANVTVQMTIAGIGGVNRRLCSPGVTGQRFNHVVFDQINGLTPGIHAVWIVATFVGNATVRSDTVSTHSAHFRFQP